MLTCVLLFTYTICLLPFRMAAITLCALGRPFSPGMLYDCRNDHLIPGVTLWNKENLDKNLYTTDQSHAHFDVITSDRIRDLSLIHI